jgi:murein L,D-transpeptidase YafK
MIRKLFRNIVILLLGSILLWYLYPGKKLDKDALIDKIIVKKGERKLEIYQAGKLLKTYRISLGRVPKGKKEFEGDMKTPEGTYTIYDKNPHSNYHLNLGISYPNEDDERYAKSKGKSPGGLIKIHGLKNGYGFIGKFHRLFDWTHGCIAMTNGEIKELFRHVPIGCEIEILD